jgi:hypothetical protein
MTEKATKEQLQATAPQEPAKPPAESPPPGLVLPETNGGLGPLNK